MLDQASSLEEYLQSVQSILKEIDAGKEKPSALVHFIKNRLEKTDAKETALIHLLQGELAFFSSNYKGALKEYIQTKELPSFQFFCYRACAFLFSAQNHTLKALDFAEKALALYSSDHSTLELACRLLKLQKREEEANALQERLRSTSKETMQVASMNKKEFGELAQVFEDSIKAEKRREENPNGISEQMRAFEQIRESQVEQYLEEEQKKLRHPQDLLYVLHSCHREEKETRLFDLIVPNSLWKGSGGYLIRWQGQGIAINPGPHFLSAFHQEGLRLAEIDAVVVTSNHPERYAEVRAIYELNALLNRTRKHKHLIRYYLNPQTYQTLAAFLHPHYKQEKHSVHCLELFLDAPDAETVEISKTAKLHYFPCSTESLAPLSPYTLPEHTPRHTSLGLRLDLLYPQEETKALVLGYASATPWSPFLSEHLQGSQILLLGLGYTSLEDRNKQRYNPECLGFHGIDSLQKELQARLLLVGELQSAHPDLRIELIKELLYEQGSQNGQPHSTLLPSDHGLTLTLPEGYVRCTASGKFVPAPTIKVMRSSERYGRLHYLAPEHFI